MRFQKFAAAVADHVGRARTFLLALLVVVAWAVTGPLFSYSDSWQLVINTGTTIVTFLMVFLIQNTQNRDGAAVQTKLDELIRTSDAEDAYIGIEKLTDTELEALHEHCLREAARTEARLKRTMAERQQRSRGEGRAAP